MKTPETLNFNFERLGKGEVFVSGDFGNWAVITEKELRDIEKGAPGKKTLRRLEENNFLGGNLDFDSAVSLYNEISPLGVPGPSLHILVLTLRCNLRCVYCRASEAGFADTNMKRKTAEKAIDFIFSVPNGNISIEFQGGEALINSPVLRHAVSYALKKNAKAGKNLNISMVSNLVLMDDSMFGFLTENKISVCTSLDGPKKVHDANRIFLGGSSYEHAVKWLKKFMEVSLKNGGDRDSLPSALMTTTRRSLPYAREIVDEYRKIGMGGIFIRPLSPIGYAKRVFSELGYSPREYGAFYEEALDYILELNARGEKFVERGAAIILAKLLSGKDPNYMDLRSPCGAGIGQMAYDWNGDIYTCDEGRMIGAGRDFLFRLGNVSHARYADIVSSGPVRMCAMASCLESQPECFRCAFKPFCGICPVHNYGEQGSVFGNMAGSYWCGIQKAVFRAVVKRIFRKGAGRIFKSWMEGRI